MSWTFFEVWLIFAAFVAGMLIVVPIMRAVRRAKDRLIDALSSRAIQGEIVEVPVYIDRPVLVDEPLLRAQLLLSEMPLLDQEEKEELLEQVKRRARNES